MGVLLRLTIPFCVFLYRGRLLQANPKNNYLIWLNIVYVIVTYLTIEIAILGRLNDLFSFVLLFSVSGLLPMSSINRKVIVALLLLFSLLLFEKKHCSCLSLSVYILVKTFYNESNSIFFCNYTDV